MLKNLNENYSSKINLDDLSMDNLKGSVAKLNL